MDKCFVWAPRGACLTWQGTLLYKTQQNGEIGLVPLSRFPISQHLTFCCSLLCVSAQWVGNSFMRVGTAPAFPLGPGNCVVLKFYMKRKYCQLWEERRQSLSIWVIKLCLPIVMKFFLYQTGQLCPDYISISLIPSLVFFLFFFSTASIATADVNSCSHTIILFMLLTLI